MRFGVCPSCSSSRSTRSVSTWSCPTPPRPRPRPTARGRRRRAAPARPAAARSGVQPSAASSAPAHSARRDRCWYSSPAGSRPDAAGEEGGGAEQEARGQVVHPGQRLIGQGGDLVPVGADGARACPAPGRRSAANRPVAPASAAARCGKAPAAAMAASSTAAACAPPSPPSPRAGCRSCSRGSRAAHWPARSIRSARATRVAWRPSGWRSRTSPFSSVTLRATLLAARASSSRATTKPPIRASRGRQKASRPGRAPASASAASAASSNSARAASGPGHGPAARRRMKRAMVACTRLP